jgi:hypothetical protein
MKMDRKTSSGSGRVLKLLEIFLRIYEIFQNPGKLLQLPEEVSGSGRSPESDQKYGRQ